MHFQRPGDALPVGRADAGGIFGIDRRQPGVHGRRAQPGVLRGHGFAHGPGNGGNGSQTAEDGPKIQPRAADQQRKQLPPGNGGDDKTGPLGEIPGADRHVKRRVAVQKMRTAALLIVCRLGRQHGHAGIDLPGIHIDHRPAEGLGQGQCRRCLARARRAEQTDDPDRRHI